MTAKQQAAAPASASGPDVNAINLLKADHRKVTALFRQFKGAGSSEEKARLAQEICTELVVHTQLEEEIFYPACRAAGVEQSTMDEAQVEHDGAKVLIAGLLHGQPGSPFYDARMAVLTEYIKHHVGEEEKPGSGIFARARAARLDMNSLGQRLQQRKQELMAEARRGELNPSAPRSLELRSLNSGKQEQSTMARQQNDRDRDDQGRFINDDDNRGGRGYASRPNERDERGRFMNEDDRGGGRSYRDEEEESRYSSRGSDSRGRGWYGDEQGHSRASQEGWENRGRSGSSRYQEQDERGGRGASGRSNERDERGRFMSDDDRSGGRSYRDDEESRYSSRGQQGRGRGWFGDAEGHARASEEGWENRGRSRSSSRDEDEDRGGRGSSGGGQGGWFGDPRGHAEASRRGWQNR